MTARLVAGVGLRPRAKGCAVVGGNRTAHLPGEIDLRVAELAGLAPDRIAARLAVAQEDVAASLARLRFVGAVTEAQAPAGPPRMVRFFERTVGVEQAAVALGRLASATVCVVGDDAVMAAVAEQLRACGIGTVSTEDGPADLVIRAVGEPTGTPTLLLATATDGIAVGPLCAVPGGRCPYCVDAPGTEHAAEPDPVTSAVAVALAVNEAIRHLTGTGHCRTSGGSIAVRGVDQSFQPLTRDPHCVHCGLSELPSAAEAEYRWFQGVDVPLKANWTHPIRPVTVHRADGTITVLPQPDGRTGTQRRQLWAGALGLATDVFASRTAQVPSIGGTQLLNAFVCGTVDGVPAAYYLDRRHGQVVPVLAPPSAAPANPLVIVAASVGRAEKHFGRKAELTVHQDTGFAVAELRRSLARKGFGTVTRDGVPAELLTGLGLYPERDVVTAVLEIVEDAPVRRGAPRQTTGVDMLTDLLAEAGVPGYVRCRGVDGIADGLHRIGARFTPVTADLDRLDTALRLRGMAPDALAVFGMDLARWQPIGPAVCAQAEAAYRVHRAARERGQPSVLLTDLPSTALDPDGRGWRTTWRSFAAVALGGELPSPDTEAVTW